MSDYQDRFREVQQEAYWTFRRIILGLVVFMTTAYAIGFLATGGDLAIYRFWAPKQANAERVVFQNTQSYVQGKTDYLSRLRLQYETAVPGTEKAAIRTLILSEASTVDNDKLPGDLQAFLRSLRGSL